jgi:hypothetical protein
VKRTALWFLRNTPGRFRELEPSSKQAGTAQKAIALRRIRIQQQPAQAG